MPERLLYQTLPRPQVPYPAGVESKAQDLRGGARCCPPPGSEPCVLALLRSSQDPVDLDMPKNRGYDTPDFGGAETSPIPSRACQQAVARFSKLKLKCQLD